MPVPALAQPVLAQPASMAAASTSTTRKRKSPEADDEPDVVEDAATQEEKEPKQQQPEQQGESNLQLMRLKGQICVFLTICARFQARTAFLRADIGRR